MGSYIKTYMRSVDKALEDENTDFAALKREHLVQIEFIQHERLIHLMVTIMCCILLFIGMCVFFLSQLTAFMVVNALLLILDFSYLIYYFSLKTAPSSFTGSTTRSAQSLSLITRPLPSF